jgi:hypothetical protein
VLVLQAAPLTSTPTILSKGRRAQSNASLLPVIVEGAGTAPFVPGPLAVWVTNAVTGQDVAETLGTVTGSTMAPLACPGASTLWCAVHPDAWSFSAPVGLATGQHSLTIAFGDGTTGTMTDDVYDAWSLSCGTGWVYQAGTIVPTTSRAASDVYDDCTNGNIVFPHAAILVSNPVTDQFGRLETVMPIITAAANVTSAFVILPIVSVQPGEVFGIYTVDNSYAKVYFASATQGLALHSNADGSYAY